LRTAFNSALLEIAIKNKKIFFICADIGYGEVERFASMFPDRFYNVGVAEQNMTGIACGLALEGNIVITYTLGNFPTLRCLEQIRNDICYHNANVKIVTIGAGLAYAPLGPSHHCTEDISIMRSLPNMVVISPCDNIEVKEATSAMIEHYGPVYLRCGRKGEKDVHAGEIDFRIGRAIEVRDGSDATIIFSGAIGYNALLAHEILLKEGINARLLSMHTLKPIDKKSIIRAAKETSTIITVDEHNINGGLGSAVAEVLADDLKSNIRFKRIALQDVFISKVGSQDWLRDQYGLSSQAIVDTVIKIIKM